ncbi:MAG: beta-galactosidase, partial [Pseudomonadota bacterium]
MMRELGLSLVRIGEFAWSRLEPEPAAYQWAWLDQVMTTLDEAGLQVVLGSPTATPPKWLVDQTPDMLAVDEQGRRRRFGSRRHYCFSSRTYLRRAQTITRHLATRYAGHPALAGWQIDNEYGCHDTIRSYSPMALRAFRRWLERRYGSIGALNAAWGTVFWSQEYRDFGAVELPFLTVTEPHPAHVLDFYRFSSDQAGSFHQALAEEVRRVSDAPVIHNFLGFEDSFDHHELAADLDVVSWDSYPLGFLDVGPYPAEDKQRYLRQGHPDFAAFHHDLYRG